MEAQLSTPATKTARRGVHPVSPITGSPAAGDHPYIAAIAPIVGMAASTANASLLQRLQPKILPLLGLLRGAGTRIRSLATVHAQPAASVTTWSGIFALTDAGVGLDDLIDPAACVTLHAARLLPSLQSSPTQASSLATILPAGGPARVHTSVTISTAASPSPGATVDLLRGPTAKGACALVTATRAALATGPRGAPLLPSLSHVVTPPPAVASPADMIPVASDLMMRQVCSIALMRAQRPVFPLLAAPMYSLHDLPPMEPYLSQAGRPRHDASMGLASTTGPVTVHLSPAHVLRANQLVEHLAIGPRLLRDDPSSPAVVSMLRRSNGTVAGRKPKPRLTTAGRHAAAMKTVALAGVAAWRAAEIGVGSGAGAASVVSVQGLSVCEPHHQRVAAFALEADDLVPSRAAAALRDALSAEATDARLQRVGDVAEPVDLSASNHAHADSEPGKRDSRVLSGHKRPRAAAPASSSLLQCRVPDACLDDAACPLPAVLSAGSASSSAAPVHR